MKRYNHSKYYILFTIVLFTLFTACSKDDNPVESSDTDHDHAEAEGLVITANDVELVRYEQGTVTGQITVAAGESTTKLTVQFIDPDGDLFVPDSDHHGVEWDIADTGIAQVVQEEVGGVINEFLINGVTTGSTTLVIKILHGDHDDFVSAAIPVVVTE